MTRILETERLRLRTWQEEDFPNLLRILSDPTTMAHWPQPLDAQAARGWYARSQAGMREQGYGRWCCELRSSGEIVGDVGIVRMQSQGQWINDLGYIIHHPHWRKGYAYEAAAAAVQWATTQGLGKLVATMAVDNEASAAVARKLGMQLLHTFNNANNANKSTYWFELQL